jgi:hypothetical protein
MATLRHPANVGLRVLSQPRRTAHTAVCDRSYARAPRVKARQRGDWLRSTLLIGRNLLLAFWAITAIAFWLAIIAGLVL